MPNQSTRTVLAAIGADLGIALAKVFAAVFTGPTAVAAAARNHWPIPPTTCSSSWLSVAAAAVPTERKGPGSGPSLPRHRQAAWISASASTSVTAAWSDGEATASAAVRADRRQRGAGATRLPPHYQAA